MELGKQVVDSRNESRSLGAPMDTARSPEDSVRSLGGVLMQDLDETSHQGQIITAGQHNISLSVGNNSKVNLTVPVIADGNERSHPYLAELTNQNEAHGDKIQDKESGISKVKYCKKRQRDRVWQRSKSLAQEPPAGKTVSSKKSKPNFRKIPNMLYNIVKLALEDMSETDFRKCVKLLKQAPEVTVQPSSEIALDLMKEEILQKASAAKPEVLKVSLQEPNDMPDVSKDLDDSQELYSSSGLTKTEQKTQGDQSSNPANQIDPEIFKLLWSHMSETVENDVMEISGSAFHAEDVPSVSTSDKFSGIIHDNTTSLEDMSTTCTGNSAFFQCLVKDEEVHSDVDSGIGSGQSSHMPSDSSQELMCDIIETQEDTPT